MSKNRIHKSSLARISAICLLAVALVLVLFSCAINGENIAFSVSPKNYIEQVVNENKDWYMDGDYLDLDRLKQTVELWKYSAKYNFNGIKPVVVAVVDSGIIADHELFTGKYDEDGNPQTTSGVGKYDVLYRKDDGTLVKICTANGDTVTSNITDDHSSYHGTHVAGIIAVLIHELNLEQYIKILPVKAGIKGEFSSGSIAAGVNEAISNGANVVNISLTSEKPGSVNWSKVVTEEQARNAVIVAAAGNSGYDSKVAAYYPAANLNVIGVMNYNKSENGKVLSGTSNYGSAYDVCAPGVDWMSANGKGKDGYINMSGTSMASPVVAFGAALRLLKSRAYANANPNAVELTPTELAKEVRSAVEKDSVTKNIFNEKYDAFDMCKLIENEEAAVKIALCEDSEGGFEQRINNIKPIKLQLKVQSASSNAEDEKVVWYKVNDDDSLGDKIGEGAEFVFMPENEVYTTRITAIWSAKIGKVQYEETAELVKISVDYIDFNPSFVRNLELNATDTDGNPLTGSQIRTGVEYEFTISDIELSAISENTRIYWFVDGQLMGEGKTFRYTFGNNSRTVVTVRVNNQFGKEFVVDFEEEIAKERALESLEISSIVAGSAIVLAIVIVFVVLAVKKKNIK